MKTLTILTCFALSFASLNVVQAAPQPRPQHSDNFTQEVINQVNRVRTNPQAYAAYLERFRAYYTEDGLFRAPGRRALRTQEGVNALDQAIRTLQHSSPQDPITVSDLLSGPGRELISSQQQSGQIGHGSSPLDRINHYGVFGGMAGENVAYGAPTAEQVVYNLVVDDGERSRGHLKNILQPGFRVAGVSQGRHPIYGSICVIDFASDFGSR